MWVILRLIIGGIFVGAGFGKLVSPFQNFLYAIQDYQLLPAGAEAVVAQVLPWVELAVGAFIFAGLWLDLSLWAASVLYAVFIAAVGQALLRHLALASCGCFGGLIHIPPQLTLVMDITALGVVLALLGHLSYAKKFSLDSYFK